MRPLLERLSQLKMKVAVGMPSERAASTGGNTAEGRWCEQKSTAGRVRRNISR